MLVVEIPRRLADFKKSRLPDLGAARVLVIEVIDEGTDGAPLQARRFDNERRDALSGLPIWSDAYGNPPESAIGEHVTGDDDLDVPLFWRFVHLGPLENGDVPTGSRSGWPIHPDDVESEARHIRLSKLARRRSDP